jgi:hypothetical protein
MGELRVRSFKATDEHWAAVHLKVQTLGVSIGELIRQAIDSFGIDDFARTAVIDEEPQGHDLRRQSARPCVGDPLPAVCDLCACRVTKADIRWGTCYDCRHPRFSHSAS